METVSDVYYKVKQQVEASMPWMKCAKYHYAKNINGVIHVMECVNIAFKDRKDEDNIARLEMAARQDGFMFFNNSEQGMEWIDNNSRAINDAFWNDAASLMKFKRKPLSKRSH